MTRSSPPRCLLATVLAIACAVAPDAATRPRQRPPVPSPAAPATGSPAGPAIDWAAWAQETKALLAEIVRIDSTNPPGHETAVCRRLHAQLATDGISSTILESAPGRGNLIARVKGTGNGRPVLWMAHLDVVGTKGQTWSVGPFEGREKDGYLYGRGVIDDKGMATIGVQVARIIKRFGPPLARDLVLALTADEESSARFGIRWLLDKHPGLLDAEVALNEGGHAVIEDGKVRLVEPQTAEKVYLDLRLEATEQSGHSSLPEPHNSIGRLARALVRLSERSMPVELNETTRAFFRGLSRTRSPDAPLMRQLVAGDQRAKARAAERLSRQPFYNALMRTTFVVTLVEGGTRVNVLPERAWANVNCRLLPGTDPRAFIRTIETFIGDPQVKVVFDAEDLEQAQASPVDHPAFRAIAAAASEVFGDITVVPLMSPGATDSRFLRGRGMPCYGLMPLPLTRDDLKRLHAADERVPVSSFEPALRLAYAVLTRLSRL